MKNADLIVICGPTASGKSGLAVELAKQLDGEIISADSMQIYKEMNIGTAKPTEQERVAITHHMLDVVSVQDEYNVSNYVSDAQICIDNVISSGKLPILVGGTGLYIDSLINNVDFFEIENDFDYRKALEEKAGTLGNIAVHEMLEEIDPKCAERLHPNDLKRVIRALEVHKVCGKTMTEIQQASIRERKYRCVFIGLNYNDRDILYSRIEQRVDIMINNGWLDEAIDLKKLGLSCTASAAIGYKELFDYLDGKIDLEFAISEIKKKTRNYAKRQLTWFRKNKEINWIFPDICIDDRGYPFSAACEIIRKSEDRK